MGIRDRTVRGLWLAAGIVLTGLGIIGLALPVMPGTVFLILAAGAFARSSPRFESWLLNHRRFGPSLRAWRETGAIPRRAKVLAVGMMLTSLFAMAIVGVAPQILTMAAVPMAGAALFILTRP
ncbi:MAG: YbaN family protein [Labrys sp. (in: a-proteobacteria)]|jgi:uncharacterized membrane protein YbaN (DUF454 family)